MKSHQNCKFTQKTAFLTILIISVWCFVIPVNAEVEFLLPEKAFELKVTANNPQTANNPYTVNIHFDIAQGYFLYQNHFKFISPNHKMIAIESISFPKALEKKTADHIHAVFANQLNFVLPLFLESHTDNLQSVLIGYQGCSEKGFCYNPIAKKITVDQNGIVEINDVPYESLKTNKTKKEIFQTTHKQIETMNNQTADSPTPNTSTTGLAAIIQTATSKPLLINAPIAMSSKKLSKTEELAEQLKEGSFLITIFIFLGIGILLAFTPCVLPMVPILANILVGENKPLTSSRSMFLASIYVFSVALCYAIAGIVAALVGTELQTSLQSPIFLVILSFILILFALSQFNFIYFQFPAFFSNALNKLNAKHKQGSAVGACTMGFVSALMVSPCVTPALVGALTYIGQTGNIFLGGAALFFLALGMGTPMLIIALLGSHLLPKAGAWMTQIKNVTGVLLMVLAGSILLRAFPTEALTNPTTTNAHTCPHVFAMVNNPSDLRIALNKAKKENQPVILDVYADWCVSCKQIDKDVFSNQTVLTTVQNVKLLRFDITKQTADQEKLKKELAIIGPPTVIFFTPSGEEAKDYRLVGKIETNDFINHFKSFLNVKK